MGQTIDVADAVGLDMIGRGGAVAADGAVSVQPEPAVVETAAVEPDETAAERTAAPAKRRRSRPRKDK